MSRRGKTKPMATNHTSQYFYGRRGTRGLIRDYSEVPRSDTRSLWLTAAED